MKYEYKVETVSMGKFGLGGLLSDSGKQEKQLNAAGKDGWELVSVGTGKSGLKYIYCREWTGERPQYTSSIRREKKELTKKEKNIWNIILGVLTAILTVLAVISMNFGGMKAIIGLFIAAVSIGVFAGEMLSKKDKTYRGLRVAHIVALAILLVWVSLCFLKGGGGSAVNPSAIIWSIL